MRVGSKHECQYVGVRYGVSVHLTSMLFLSFNFSVSENILIDAAIQDHIFL